MSDTRAKITFFLPSNAIEMEGDIHAVHALAEFLWGLPATTFLAASEQGLAADWSPLVILGWGTQFLTFPVRTPFILEVPPHATTSSAMTQEVLNEYGQTYNPNLMAFKIELGKDLFPVNK